MAIIQQPESNGFDLGALAPAGTFVATCLEVQDQFGVQRPKFENPQEMETLDVTRFLFGFADSAGQLFRVQSFEFRITGSPKSNLIKFLTSWLGRTPQYGWDYCELKGQGAMITVSHKPSRDGSKTYANLIAIAPVIDQLKSQVLSVERFHDDPSAGAPVPTQPPTPPQQPALATAKPWSPATDSFSNCPF